jgi:hypothetical protein
MSQSNYTGRLGDHSSSTADRSQQFTLPTAIAAIAKSRVVFAALLLASVLAVALTFKYEWAMELSAFTIGLAKATMGIALVRLIDHFIFHGFNTREEVRRGNIAAALYLVGLFAFTALILFGT